MQSHTHTHTHAHTYTYLLQTAMVIMLYTNTAISSTKASIQYKMPHLRYILTDTNACTYYNHTYTLRQVKIIENVTITAL